MKAKVSRSSHVLVTLGVLFTLGAASRFMFSNFATADETAQDTVAEAPAEVTAPVEPVDYSEATAPTQICFSEDIAAKLQEDQLIFAEQQDALQQEKVDLEAWAQDLERQTAELKMLQETLDTRWADMQVVADRDMEHLAQMYGTMKPDAASQIFNQMDPAFAAGFLRLLPSEQAGLIMANMETDKAYVVSVELATMNHDIRLAAAENQRPQ